MTPATATLADIQAALDATDAYVKREYARDIASGRGPRTRTEYNALRWCNFVGALGITFRMTDAEIRALHELPVDEYTANRVESARWLLAEADARQAGAA